MLEVKRGNCFSLRYALLIQTLYTFPIHSFQTNYPDRLDPALTRPGRIDVKIEYKLSSKAQAKALFTRFFSSQRLEKDSSITAAEGQKVGINGLAEEFAQLFPGDEFSTAALQGYLLSCRENPVQAVEELTAWIEKERRERSKKERERKEKQMAEWMKSRAGFQPLMLPAPGPLE